MIHWHRKLRRMAQRVMPYRVRPAPEVPLSAGPFSRVVESLDPTASQPDALTAALNMFPLSAAQGAGWWGRPGYAPLGGELGRVQGIVQHKGSSTSAERLIAVVSGAVYRFDPGLNVWVKIPATVPLSLFNRVYFTEVAGKLVISDGENKPVVYDNGAGTITQIAAAPTLAGPIVTYYGKLVGVQLGNPQYTLVWSEENDPFTGYGTGGSDNAWDFAQTSSDRITALHAANDGLYIFRRSSITMIMGPTEDAFQSAGVRESISETVGTEGEIVSAGDKLFFLDQECRPRCYVRGGGIMDPGAANDALVSTAEYSPAGAPAARWSFGNLVLLGAEKGDPIGQSFSQIFLVMDGASGTYLGIWKFAMRRIFSFGRVIHPTDGRPHMAHGDFSGSVHLHGTPEHGDGPWTDDGAAIEHVLNGPYQAYDTAHDKKFSRVDVAHRAPNALTELYARIETPNGLTPDLAYTVPGRPLVWGVSKYGETPEAIPNERKASLGFDQVGRWARLALRHTGPGQQYGVEAWTVTAQGTSKQPRHR